jgi:hypothetical protein
VAQKDQPAEYFKGIRVAGHAPGELEKAKALHDAQKAHWDSLSPQDRLIEEKGGNRDPGHFDPDAWRLKTKKAAVNRRGYELQEAAEQCAEMARKAGWLDVEIIRMERRKQ